LRMVKKYSHGDNYWEIMIPRVVPGDGRKRFERLPEAVS